MAFLLGDARAWMRVFLTSRGVYAASRSARLVGNIESKSDTSAFKRYTTVFILLELTYAGTTFPVRRGGQVHP